MAGERWFKGNDNILKLTGLKDVDGNPQNAATVTARIVDFGGVEILAAQTLSYVAGSDGDYEATIDKDAIESIPDGPYKIEWTAAQSGADGQWVQSLIIGPRKV